jgi:transposase
MEEGANVMIMIGCDFHPGMEEIAMLDLETGHRQHRTLRHAVGTEEVRSFYAALAGPVRVGLEASGYSQWYEEMLEELGIELWVGDPGRIRKAAPRKQKTDRKDASLLLQLLEENRFPRIWVPDRATRDLRQLLMHRHKLVTMRAAVSNQLQAIAINRGLRKKGSLWSERGRAELQALDLPPWAAVRRNELLGLREQWDREIAVFNKVLLESAEQHPEARYLMHHQQGVGPVTAMAVVLTLGPVERFASARKVASYVGLIPAEYSSGARQRLGHITKEGNTFLRWVLVEAATVAVRHDPAMKQMYWRLVERRGKSIAKVAMARRLLVRLYWMLRRRKQAIESRRKGLQRATVDAPGQSATASQGSSALDMAAVQGRNFE